ncbi:23S rRNA (guanosine(2251)-2'-O)-methyltransferase RlmB [Piscirickettsia litoralis]|uniref:23S rRNA (guanosine-2'-O-)-methyltransferase RlmB n=1 Tax=Piscirickettsia litoralis TaxID=1891921 RepID=A0ABX3A356_9GAMM|nr:23S rRNA (guanosine(2251)-2'-O)-methyltransferase RlmB [Piscirickettsia litoralis]ODN42066.1 23S rRNA (guanosine(2251)-2'-O)-methyltransferase RlmB [Piscirickettsia litoralis]
MKNSKELIFGIHAVSALLKRAPEQVKVLYLLKGRSDPKIDTLVDLARQGGVTIERVTRSGLDRLAPDQTHQGVVAHYVGGHSYNEDDLHRIVEKAGKDAWLLILDGVEDPHNLGACLRTAEAAGVTAVIAQKNRSAPLSATARKVACGAAETLPLVLVTNLSRTIESLQQEGFWVTGLAGEAEKSVYEIDFSGRQIIILGAEGTGMRRLTREHCDFLAHIPMAGAVSSLNVSVATGVCLFEAVRQRQLGGK